MKKKLTTTVFLLSAITATSSAYAWVPVLDDLKKAAEDIGRGVVVIGCGAAAGSATGGNPVAVAGAVGACANAVK